MKNLLRQFEISLPAVKLPDAKTHVVKELYDPELVYVECRACGRPVFWEPGRTTMLLAQSNVSLGSIDEHCLILSEGCHECSPVANGYSLSIVRLSDVSLDSFLLMQKPQGHA